MPVPLLAGDWDLAVGDDPDDYFDGYDRGPAFDWRWEVDVTVPGVPDFEPYEEWNPSGGSFPTQQEALDASLGYSLPLTLDRPRTAFFWMLDPGCGDNDGGMTLDVYPACEVRHPFGDVTLDNQPACPPGPGGAVSGCGFLIDLPDIVYVLNAFAQGAAWAECYPNADLMAAMGDVCSSDGTVSLPDIVAVVNAFAGSPDCESPCACP